ncbi:MAG: hypothetical protein R3D84_04800 [Paracoccaceae bacterium]
MRFPLSRAVLALAVMALAMVVAFVGTAICRALLEARGVEGFRHYPEIFARLFVLVLVAAWLVHGWKTRGGLFATDAPRWLRLSLWALLAGFLTSALDPWSPISDEMNVVRYSTSGFLLLASATLFAAQLAAYRWSTAPWHWVSRWFWGSRPPMKSCNCTKARARPWPARSPRS